MAKEKIIFGMCMIIMIAAGIAIAQNAGDSGQQNYNDPQWINNNLATADFSKITDWSQVDQSRIPATRIGEVPADKLSYSRLGAEQRQQMNSGQISQNFNNIQNLRSDVNPLAAQTAIKDVFGAIVGLGTGQGPVSVLNGVLKTDAAQVSLESEAYKEDKGSLSVDDKGNIVFTPKEGATGFEFPKEDKILIDTNIKGQGVPAEYQEVKVRVPGTTNEAEISGRVLYDKGKFSVMKGEQASINGYAIDNSKSNEDLQILFDQKDYVRNAVVFNRNQVKAYGSGFTLETDAGVPIKLFENTKVSIDSTPSTTIARSINNNPDDVRALQSALNRNGFYNTVSDRNIDEQFGPNTQNAVIMLQRDLGLAETGIYDEQTRAAFEKAYGPMITVEGDASFPEAQITVNGGKAYEPAEKAGQQGKFQLTVGKEEYFIRFSQITPVDPEKPVVQAGKVREVQEMPGIVETDEKQRQMEGEEAKNLVSTLKRMSQRQVEKKLGVDIDEFYGEERAQALKGYKDIIQSASQKYDVDPEIMDKLIQIESGGNPYAVSSAQCRGLMQISNDLSSAKHIEGSLQGTYINPFSPEQNIDRGTAYLAVLIEKYDGNVGSALTAYNMGPGNYKKFEAKYGKGATSQYAKAILGQNTETWGTVKPVNTYN